MADERDKIWSNPVLGTETFFHYDEGTDEVALETVQDVEGILDTNKRLQADNINARFGDGQVVARIPLILLRKWIEEGKLVQEGNAWVCLDGKDGTKLLNDSDYSALRTFPGRI